MTRVLTVGRRWRLDVIRQAVMRPKGSAERKAALEAIAAQEWRQPDGKRNSISRATLYAWVASHDAKGLLPDVRKDKGVKRVIVSVVWDGFFAERLAEADHRAVGDDLTQYIRSLWASGESGWRAICEKSTTRLIELSRDLRDVAFDSLPLGRLGNGAGADSQFGVCDVNRRLAEAQRGFSIIAVRNKDNARFQDIIAAIALIAAGAVMIYRNWDAIAAWFSALWSSVVGAFKAAWAWISSAVDRLTPAPIKAAWSILTTYFTGLWDGVMQVFRGVVDFVAGIFTGDMDRAASGLRQIWDGFKTYISAIFTAIGDAIKLVWTSAIKPIFDKLGLTDGIAAAWGVLKAAFDLHLNAISAVFSFVWDNAIKPLIDGLQSVGGVGAVWEGMKAALESVMDWLGSKFEWLLQKVSPVIDALKWVQGKGAAALQSLGLTGGDAGPGDMPASSGAGDLPHFAKGGSFGRGPIVVGEKGPELRYENRGGFIAHHRALQEMARLSARATSGARRLVDPSIMAGGRGGKSISFAPSYAVTVNGTGNAAEVEAVVNRALATHAAQMKVDLRRQLND